MKYARTFRWEIDYNVTSYLTSLVVVHAQNLLKIRCRLRVNKEETLPSFRHQLQQRLETGNNPQGMWTWDSSLIQGMWTWDI